MQSDLFKLNSGDLMRGSVTAIVAAVLMSLMGIVQQTGFDVFTADWHSIANIAINSAVAAFVGYLGKNLLTTSDGKILGHF